MSIIIDEWKDVYDATTNNGCTAIAIYRALTHTHPAPSFLADGVTPYPGRWSSPSGFSQSFRGSSVDLKLAKVKFNGRRNGNPVGPLRAVIYTHSGVYGDLSSRPSIPIAYSEPVEASTIPTSYDWWTFNFVGANQVLIQANAPYFVAIEAPPEGNLFGDVNNDNVSEYGQIQPRCESSATPIARHGGIQCQFLGSDPTPSWQLATTTTESRDMAFAVLGDTTATANIIGTVTDLTQGGAGFPNATVELIADNSVVASTYTDGSGNYSFNGVTAKQYTLRASATPYYNVVTAIIDASGASPPDYVVNLALDAIPPFTLWGYMRYPDGSPVSGAQLDLVPFTEPAPVFTQADGSYTFPNVPRQNYRLQLAVPISGYYSVDDQITAPATGYNTLRHDITLRSVVAGIVPEPPNGQCYHVLGVLYSATSHQDAVGINNDVQTFLTMVNKQNCYAVECMATGDITQNIFTGTLMPGDPRYATDSFKPMMDNGICRAIIVGMNMFQNGSPDCTPILNAIASGAYDSTWLAPRVAQCKNFKDQNGNLYPIMIRLSPEFNQNWGTQRAGNPASFIAAWRHVVDYFRANGVTNVSWQWSVGWQDVGIPSGYTFRDYYPGDDYVDWTGIDAYWMGSTDQMAMEIAEVYNWLYNDANGPHSIRPCSLSEWGFKNNVNNQWSQSSDTEATTYFTGAFNTFENNVKIKMIRLHWASTDNAGNGFIFQDFNPSYAGYYPIATGVYRARIANSRYLSFEPTAQFSSITLSSSANGYLASPPVPNPYSFVVGSTVYLDQFQPTPNTGYSFNHWELDGVSVGSPLTITLDMHGKTLTAIFTQQPQPITLNIAISGSGTINIATGNQTFNVGETVELIASTQNFLNWTLNGTTYTANPLNLTITADMAGKTLTANFTSPFPMSIPIVAGIAFIGGFMLFKSGGKKNSRR